MSLPDVTISARHDLGTRRLDRRRRRGGSPPLNACRAVLAGVAIAGAAIVTGCTTTPNPEVPPPPPPAACLLDTAALAGATGLGWTPDATTASDTRCVYDPTALGVPGDDPAFVSVEVAPAQGPDPAAQLDTVAELCQDGSRAPVTAGDGGFVCRFQGGNVYAALVRRGELVTLASSAVPPGTTAAQLVIAFDQQLTAIAR